MIWNDHSRDVPEGAHAFLSPSKSSWIRYSDEQLRERWGSHNAAINGTELHELAAQLIRKKIKLKGTHQTFNMYVNDAIGFHLTPEVPLYFSPICFGTADAIGYNEKKRFLRIHDLKTGKTTPHMEQLFIYSALFCLEYEVDPFKMDGVETRLYWMDDILIDNPPAEEIKSIMDTIVDFNKQIISWGDEIYV